jgi:hypothetical protein
VVLATFIGLTYAGRASGLNGLLYAAIFDSQMTDNETGLLRYLKNVGSTQGTGRAPQ